MNNSEVIKSFLNLKNAKTNLRKIPNGDYIYKGRTLHTGQEATRFCLYNYNTIIAFIVDNTLYLNSKKYSPTTSKIQIQLAIQAKHTDYKIKYYESEVK